MSKKYTNSLKNSFIANLPTLSIDDSTNELTTKCKFNFAYFDYSQACSQNFSDWNQEKLSDLLDKLKSFSQKPLTYWQSLPIGSGRHRSHVLEIYGTFPKKSAFIHPAHVPFEAQWGRFRLNNMGRLIGFVIPSSHHNNAHPTTAERFDKNTFYIVFLDEHHQFYLT